MKEMMSSNYRFYLYIIISLFFLMVLSVCLSSPLTKHIMAKQLPFMTSGLSAQLNDCEMYQSFITPDNEVIVKLAASLSSIEEIYTEANDWVYVSDPLLNATDDKWLTPHEFLSETPSYPANPVPGLVVGDCEEQANTTVSLLRAFGVSPENVRVVLGNVSVSKNIIRGHVWVELLVNDKWMALDPSQGNQWNENFGQLMADKGKIFDYYYHTTYPVPSITAYYNDIYYLDVRNNRGNAPESWKTSE